MVPLVRGERLLFLKQLVYIIPKIDMVWPPVLNYSVVVLNARDRLPWGSERIAIFCSILPGRGGDPK